jgi:hypothetical protein
MKLHVVGTANRLNIESSLADTHRTSNAEHRIMMALRFIYFKTSEPQNNEYRTAACNELSRVEFRRLVSLARRVRRVLLSSFNKIDRIQSFDIRYSLIDIRYLSAFGGFAFYSCMRPSKAEVSFSIKLVAFQASGCAEI